MYITDDIISDDYKTLIKLKQKFIVTLINHIGILFTFTFAIKSLIENHTTLSISLFSTTFILSINYFFIFKSKINLASNIIVYLFFTLFIYLVYSGGVENSGILWVYAFPAIALILHNLKQGIIEILLFILSILAIFIFSNHINMIANYSYELKLHLISSLLLIFILTSIYEYSNNDMFIKMNQLSKKLEMTSTIDTLTNVYNRRGMYKYIKRTMMKTKETNSKFSLLLLDIDHFKKINDTYGHLAGDQVLKDTALIIRNTIRKDDIIARWGGEEFLILLPNTTKEESVNIAQKIRKNIKSKQYNFFKDKVFVTVSIGISEDNGSCKIDNIVGEADKNMYIAKESGRDRVYPKL